MKKKIDKDKVIELIVVILLGITAVMTAWASWIGSLHAGNQSTNYTTSNNLAAEGNADWNEASQQLNSDMQIWNEVSNLELEVMFASDNNNTEKLDESAYKLYFVVFNNCSEEFMNKIDFPTEGIADNQDITDFIVEWVSADNNALISPFSDQEYINSYFTDAQAKIDESAKILEQGKKDNHNGDTYGLVSVIYSVVLFLLGIVGTFKGRKNKVAVMGISLVAFIFATIFMFTIPLPDGFAISSFFGA